MGSVGFKEWALVCDALGRGEQTIILRKGGIAEGREGFSFKAPEFFLFPTFFHEQVERMRGPRRELPMRTDGEIEIRFFAKVELAATIRSWELAEALEPFHVLRTAVVRERFEYDRAPGIHVGFLRVFRLSMPWTLPAEPHYRGCRSWVQLPELPSETALQPVLGEVEHARRYEQFAGMMEEPVAAVYDRRSSPIQPRERRS